MPGTDSRDPHHRRLDRTTTRSSSAPASPAARRRSCSAAPALRVALVEKQPDPQAFKRICSHFIQASAVPTLERLGLLEPIEAAGGAAPAHARVDPVGLDRSAARARRAAASTCAARCSTRWCARPRPRRPGVELMLGLERRAAAARRRGASPASSSATARATRRELRARARRRRRRARLADRRALRRAGQDPPARPLRLRRLLRGPAAGARARQHDLDPRPAVGGRLPDRQRPHLLRGDADQGPPAGVQARPRGGAGQVRRRRARGAADPRVASWSNRCSARST